MPQQSAYQTPIFQPARRTITAITNANPALVTCSFATQYEDGDIVRIVFPLVAGYPIGFGMPELNNQIFNIQVNDDSSFYINIDTTGFTPFVDISTTSGQFAQVIPVGDTNLNTPYNATFNTLPTLTRTFVP